MRGNITITEDGKMISDIGNIIKWLKPWIYSYEIKKYFHNRSNEQNKYYRILLWKLSNHTGYSDNEMHEIIKWLFLSEKIRLKWDKRKKVNIPWSTKTLKTNEFNELMSKIRHWGAQEFWLYLPKPGESPELLHNNI